MPQGATDTSVAIKDSTGKTLRTISVGAVEAGKHDFAWDGKNDAGEAVTPGPVTIEATANVGGKREALNTSVYALVQAVSLPTANSPMTVELLGVGPVSFDKIQKISSSFPQRFKAFPRTPFMTMSTSLTVPNADQTHITKI